MAKTEKAAVNIFNTIRDRIVSMEYPSGSMLYETKIAEEFNVSRTPVREVFQRLEQEKLVSLSKVGAMVSPVDLHWMRDSMEARKVLDAVIAAMAVDRATDEQIAKLLALTESFYREENGTCHINGSYIQLDGAFHDMMLELSDSTVMRELYETMHYRCVQFWHYLKVNTSSHDTIDASLRTLAEEARAIAARDTATAKACAIAHVDAYMDVLINRLR